MNTIGQILDLPDFSYLSLINAPDDLSREVNAIETTETPDVADYLPKNTFLLTTGMAFKDDPDGFCDFLTSLNTLPVAGVAIKLGRYINDIDQKVIDHANALSIPLVEIPKEQTLGSVSHHLLSHIWENQAGTMQMALNLQKQFSEMMLKGSTVENIVKYLGSILKKPIILQDPFFNIVAHSQHYNHSNHSLEEVTSDIMSILKDKIQLYLKTRSTKSFKNDKYYIYPIQIDAHFNFYLILKKQKEEDFPLSELILEQAGMVLSHTVYKNLKLVQESVHAKNSFFNKLLTKEKDKNINWFEYGDSFDLVVSEYYRIGICEFSSELSQKSQSPSLQFNLIYDWFEKQLSKRDTHIILFPIDSDNSFGFLIQSKTVPIEHVLDELNTTFKEATLFHFNYYLGNPVFTVKDLHYSYKEAIELRQTLRNADHTDLFNYYETKDMNELLHYIPEHVKRHFCMAVLKDMAYPEDDAAIELRNTLKVFLDSQSEIKLSSERLFVHRNTVKYRIAKCKELLDTNLDDPKEILNLRIALEIVEEKLI